MAEKDAQPPAEFTVIPADSKGYPGMTKLKIDDKRDLVCMGVGPDVEAHLIKRRKERNL